MKSFLLSPLETENIYLLSFASVWSNPHLKENLSFEVMCEMALLAVSPWGFGYIPENSCEQPQIPVLQLPSCAFGINLFNRAIECKGNA